jgi:hypothetical protein
MSSPVEYLFAPDIALAKAFARKQGWREYGRAAWQKRDGCVVYFLSLAIQLEIISAGEVVHVVGKEEAALPILKRLRAIAVCHAEAVS